MLEKLESIDAHKNSSACRGERPAELLVIKIVGTVAIVLVSYQQLTVVADC